MDSFQKKTRFEVGYGLEPILTDDYTFRLQQKVINPLFKEGRYFEGISAGIEQIKLKMGGLDITSEEDRHGNRDPEIGTLGKIIYGFLAILVFLLSFRGLRNALRDLKGDELYNYKRKFLLYWLLNAICVWKVTSSPLPNHVESVICTFVAYFLYLFMFVLKNHRGGSGSDGGSSSGGGSSSSSSSSDSSSSSSSSDSGSSGGGGSSSDY